MALSGDIDLCWYRAETARYQKKYLTWISSRSSTCCVFYFFISCLYFPLFFSVFYSFFFAAYFFCFLFLLYSFLFCFGSEEEWFFFCWDASFEDSFWGSFKVLLGYFWSCFWSCFWRFFCLFVCGSWKVVAGAEGAGRKGCLQTEDWDLLCKCKEDNAGGRMRAGQAGRKYSGEQEALLAYIKIWRYEKLLEECKIPDTSWRILYRLPDAECRLPAGAREKSDKNLCSSENLVYCIYKRWGREIFLDA